MREQTRTQDQQKPQYMDSPEYRRFQEWLGHPETARLRKWAETQRQTLMEAWADGSFSSSFTMEMMAKNAGATGGCSVLSQIIEMDYQQIHGE